jgi:serine/threonine protein kinase
MIETGKLLQQRYRIDKQIGQGGMGAVYIATDERFGSTVAIKETLLMDDNYRKAIEREARLLNSLKHAALPRVSDHFLEENGQFLVMEYIPGEDLSHMIESGVRFEIERVLKWADQLLDALDFLHNQSTPVIHRDIKPQNLKLSARDQIILLDFGLAKGNPTDAGHQTAAKSIFGYSRNYASLEQIQGTGTDPRSDLYSLAATLYHLLTSVPPEDALTRAMAVLSNRPDPLQPATVIRPDIHRGVAGVLQKALSLSADDRPATAAAMREMFRQYEIYAHLAEPATIAGRRASTDVHAEKTRIMASDTRQELGGQTDVKTAILPGYASHETSVRAAIDTGGVTRPKGSRSLVIGAALGAVLAICGSALGWYMYESSAPGSDLNEPVAVEPIPQQAGPENPSANTSAEAETAAIDTKANETARQTTQATKTAETTKPSKQATTKDTAKVDSGDLVVDGETIYAGNVKIGPDGMRPNVYVDRNGVRHPLPPPTNAMPFPGITREQFEKMTPRQKQQLMEARRRLLMLEKQRPTPSPQ